MRYPKLDRAVAPMFEALAMAVIEDAGSTPASELPPAPATMAAVAGDDPDAVRSQRLARAQQERASSRLHTAYDDLEFKATVKGTKSSFLIDETIGFRTSGLSQVMKIFPPGGFQSMHAHPGEAWLYIIEGRGHSYFGSEPTGGQTVQWQAGDLVCVDHHCWHQHFNDDPDDVVRMIRVHMVDSVNMILRAVADPMVLTPEPKWALEQVPDISAVEFPKEHRPLPS